MSPEKQRVAIAEACGTLVCPGCGWKDIECISHDHKSPDYLNDLNAIASAEATLKWPYSTLLYAETLRSICSPDRDRLAKEWSDTELCRATLATAAQRAEALLKTLNLWVEETEKGSNE